MARGYEVAVHGGGVAGCIAAILLARTGRRVVQFVAPRRARCTPAEILSPWSRSLLSRLNLPEPPAVSICTGILSCWGGEPDFQDYRFMTASDGLAIRRDDLRDTLNRTARDSGVDQQSSGWRSDSASLDDKIDAPYRLVAQGRAFGQKRGHDRLVALFISIEGAREDPRLLVEAVPAGWWYRPPVTNEHAMLVFVTDPEVVPRGRAAQVVWLADNFARSTIMVAACGNPRFDAVAGMDARVGIADNVAWKGGACLGDSALSLDPLSGTGIAKAIEGAALLAGDIEIHGEASERYRQWIGQTYVEESAMRNGLYRLAAVQFPSSTFWKRALEGVVSSARSSI